MKDDRLSHVRMLMQRIIGILFVVIAIVCCFIVYVPGNPEDMSGAILLAIFGVFLIVSKEYLFFDDDSDDE